MVERIGNAAMPASEIKSGMVSSKVL